MRRPGREHKPNGGRFWRDAAGWANRRDGPVIEYDDGRKEWWVPGTRHRFQSGSFDTDDHWFQVTYRKNKSNLDEGNGV